MSLLRGMKLFVPLVVALATLWVNGIVSAQSQTQNQNQALPPCFEQASDVDGDGFGWEYRSCLVTVESYPPPSFINRATGMPVDFVRAYWTIEDLANKPFSCQLYDWLEPLGDYFPYSWVAQFDHDLSEQVTPFLGRQTQITYSEDGEVDFERDGLWYFNDGRYLGNAPMGGSYYIEQPSTPYEVRVWDIPRNTRYWKCSADDPNVPLVPTTYAPTTNITDLYYVRCEDTPPTGDRWGWDGYGSCVYQYGEDEFLINQRYVTAEYVGAEPLMPSNDHRAPSGAECIDTDGDGWGWDGTDSCVVSTEEAGTPLDCVDSDGDGWGWNGVESCVVDDDDGCDYSDADLYSGWGWNAATMESCPPAGN